MPETINVQQKIYGLTREQAMMVKNLTPGSRIGSKVIRRNLPVYTTNIYPVFIETGLTAATDHDDGDPDDIEPGSGLVPILYYNTDDERLAYITDDDGVPISRVCLNLFQEAVDAGKFGIAAECVDKTLWLIAVLCP